MKVFLLGAAVGYEENAEAENEARLLESTATLLGAKVVAGGHDLLICSPFKDSVDYYAALGAANVEAADPMPYVEFHYPDSPGVDREVRNLINSLNIKNVRLFSHTGVSDSDNSEARKYSWLLAQINALENCNVIVAMGGKHDGSASFLLRIAEARRKSILPLRFLGGAASRLYDRLQYELHDKIGDNLPILNDPDRITEVIPLAQSLATSTLGSPDGTKPLEFFISYPRSRPGEADYVEALLRRRNFTVFRDEEDFRAGTKTYEEIRQHIFKATVFVALWCKDYACSPWCFDELDLALDRNDEGKMALWIVVVDETRIVPPRARGLTFMNGRSRAEIEASIRHFLDHVG
jgi:hypothetical protein